MLFLKHIVTTAWDERVALFWPIWITITLAAVAGVSWLAGWKGAPANQEPRTVPIIPSPRRHVMGSRGSVIVLPGLALLLVFYIAASLIWEDFTWYDNSQFTLFSLSGSDLRPFIGQANGRFFPLALQEFNVLRHFTHTAAGYHAFRIVELVVVTAVLLILDDALGISARAALAILALITPSILISFTDILYLEANVLLCLAALALCVRQFERTHGRAWAGGAALFTQLLLYCKETSVILLLGFVAARLILRCWNADRPGWNWSRLRDKDSRLDFCLASLAAIFLLYYAAIMFPHPNLRYADQQRLPLADVALIYVRLDLLAWLLMASVMGRVYLIMRRKTAPWLLWDGLALGGTACFLAYIYLGLTSGYYLAPVDLIAVLYIGRIVILSMAEMGGLQRAAVLIVLLTVVIQDSSLSAFRTFERKNVIHAKTEIAGVIEAQYRSGTGSAPRLFFPFASPYVIMELASYLAYRGLPIETARDQSADGSRVVLTGQAIKTDGLCVDYRNYFCRAASRPVPGDLVIVLPDDDAPSAAALPYQQHGELLLSYEPFPRIPQWLEPLVGYLHVISPIFENKTLPDRWLHAFVTKAS